MSTQLFDTYVAYEQPDGTTTAQGEASGLYYRFLQLPDFNDGVFIRKVTRWFEGIPAPEAAAWAVKRGYLSIEFMDVHRCGTNGDDLHVAHSENNLTELALMFEEGQALMDQAAETIKDAALLKLQLGGYAV